MQKIELVLWEEIQRDCKLPESDNNDGYVFGINLIDWEGEGDIIDVQWFKTNEERMDFIAENKLKILDNY